jgi:F-type H+-transporting ATPase subunit b
MVLEARQEVGEMQDRWYAAIEHEKQLFLQDLRARLSEQLLQIARRALSDLAHVDLERAIINVFIERLRALAAEDSPQRAPDAEPATKSVVVRSTFELPPPLRRHVEESLQDILFGSAPNHDRPGDHLHVHFTHSPDLMCGIEAQVRDRRIAWNLRDYLDGLEEALDSAFRTDGTQEERHTQLYDADLAAGGILPA